MSVLLKPYAIVPGRPGPSRFYLADCLDVFRQLPAQSVDVIVTSPPYNLGIHYNQYEDALPRAQANQQVCSTFSEIHFENHAGNHDA